MKVVPALPWHQVIHHTMLTILLYDLVGERVSAIHMFVCTNDISSFPRVYMAAG